jgi:hypothetical protein
VYNFQKGFVSLQQITVLTIKRAKIMKAISNIQKALELGKSAYDIVSENRHYHNAEDKKALADIILSMADVLGFDVDVEGASAERLEILYDKLSGLADNLEKACTKVLENFYFMYNDSRITLKQH